VRAAEGEQEQAQHQVGDERAARRGAERRLARRRGWGAVLEQQVAEGQGEPRDARLARAATLLGRGRDAAGRQAQLVPHHQLLQGAESRQFLQQQTLRVARITF